MTGRQRLLTVLRRGVPDRVPVTPDVAVMMPCRYTGKPFWDVLYGQDPPLWKAHIALQKRFGYDAIASAGLGNGPEDESIPREERILSQDDERWLVESITHTRKGDLSVQTVYFRNTSTWISKPLITDPERELDALLSTLTDPWSKSTAHFTEVREALGDTGILSSGTPVPPAWWLYCRRDLSRSVLDFYDRRALVEKAMAAYTEWSLELLRATCAMLHPDLLLFGGSVASMSLLNPQLYRQYALPWLQQASAIAKDHGAFSGVHMCGRSRSALPILAESGIDLVEPLESPPGGDVSLAQAKEEYGHRFVLKGNVNTFSTLARGTVEDVLREARGVIAQAGEGGGLILSSGDQVGVDTPEENFVALIRAALEYGRYDGQVIAAV